MGLDIKKAPSADMAATAAPAAPAASEPAPDAKTKAPKDEFVDPARWTLGFELSGGLTGVGTLKLPGRDDYQNTQAGGGVAGTIGVDVPFNPKKPRTRFIGRLTGGFQLSPDRPYSFDNTANFNTSHGYVSLSSGLAYEPTDWFQLGGGVIGNYDGYLKSAHAMVNTGEMASATPAHPSTPGVTNGDVPLINGTGGGFYGAATFFVGKDKHVGITLRVEDLAIPPLQGQTTVTPDSIGQHMGPNGVTLGLKQANSDIRGFVGIEGRFGKQKETAPAPVAPVATPPAAHNHITMNKPEADALADAVLAANKQETGGATGWEFTGVEISPIDTITVGNTAYTAQPLKNATGETIYQKNDPNKPWYVMVMAHPTGGTNTVDQPWSDAQTLHSLEDMLNAECSVAK